MARKKSEGWQRADEFLAERARDPEFQKRERERQKKLAALEAMLADDECPLVKALCEAGVHVESVWDLVNTSQPYPQAIPVLMEHLGRPYHIRTREGIVRALTVPEARGIAFGLLCEEFRNTSVQRYGEFKWVLGNALSVIADASTMDTIVELLRDRRHGHGRSMLVRALKSMPPEQRAPLLDEFEDDPDLQNEVRHLRRRKRRRK